MEVRISKETGKVKISNDEMIVRVNGKDNIRHVPINLKAKFEETISLIRALEKPPKHIRQRKTVLPEVSCPKLNAHAILQTLYKLVWQGHAARYTLLTSTFRTAIQSKVLLTKRLREFDDKLAAEEDEIIKNVRQNAKSEPDLDAFRKALGKEGGIDDLIEAATERGVAATGEDTTYFAPLRENVLPRVGQFDAANEKLWEEWKLQIERHKLVYKGDLDAIDAIDKEIAKLREREDEVDLPTTDNGIALYTKMYREMIEQLSAIKMEQEIRASVLDKYEKVLRAKMQSGRQKAYAKIRSDIVQEESLEIERTTAELRLHLDKIKAAQDRAIAEIKSSTRDESVLKSMQISIDLTLESAREFLYTEGLDALSPWN